MRSISHKSIATAVIFTLVCAVLIVDRSATGSGTSSALANTSVHRVVRGHVLSFKVVKHTRRYDVVQGHAHRFAIKRGVRKVTVRDLGRCTVVKRTARVVVLRTPAPTSTPTPTPPPAGDPIAAIKAATAGQTVVVPAGTFAFATLSVPDGVTVVGAGMAASWLQGHIDFGSNSTFSDLKIGPASAGNSAVRNGAGAHHTVFERVRFRGGGGRAFTYVIDLGSGAAASHITFKDSEVERNLGVESGGDQGFNDIGIWIGTSGPVSDITFDGVHVGVSNGQGGHDTGAPRFGIECYTDPGSGTSGWQNITIRNSVFEAADMETADFSDTPTARGTGLLIEGNTFKGGGYANVKWKYVLNFEMPLGGVVRNNTFLRGYGGWGSILNVTDRGNTSYTGPGAVFTGNTFDLDTDNGIATEPDAYPIVIKGSDNQFTNNTIQCHYGSNAVVLLDGAHNNTVTGNTFDIGTRSSLSEINGSSGNTISSNTLN